MCFLRVGSGSRLNLTRIRHPTLVYPDKISILLTFIYKKVPSDVFMLKLGRIWFRLFLERRIRIRKTSTRIRNAAFHARMNFNIAPLNSFRAQFEFTLLLYLYILSILASFIYFLCRLCFLF